MMGVELSAGDWGLACLIGAAVGLDCVSWPQAMWSRPIVAGTLGGLLFGAPAAGCLVGVWLEVVLSRHPPFGGARHPEPGPASFVAGAAFAVAGGGAPAGVVAAVATGWAIGWTGAYSVALLRRVTPRLVSPPEGFGGGAAALARRHRLAIALDGMRGGLLVATLLIPSVLFVRFVSNPPGGGAELTWWPVPAGLGLAGAAGVAARGLGARRRAWPALAAGMFLGFIIARVVA